MGMVVQVYAMDDAAIEAIAADPDSLITLIESDHPSAYLDKAWHAIHFLLTGSVWGGEAPLNLLLAPGNPVGADLGMGPGRAFSSAEVKVFADALDGITGQVLMSRFDGEAMNREKIYPEIWDEPDVGEYVTHHFDALKRYIIEARTSGHAALVVMT